jgi:hypothetical protein
MCRRSYHNTPLKITAGEEHSLEQQRMPSITNGMPSAAADRPTPPGERW